MNVLNTFLILAAILSSRILKPLFRHKIGILVGYSAEKFEFEAVN